VSRPTTMRSIKVALWRMAPDRIPAAEDANRIEPYDGSEWHDAWTNALEYKILAMVETAAVMMRAAGREADLPGLMALLWSLDGEEAEIFLEDHRALIEEKAATVL
jgi:hypothetical protein